jgi:hypothetical protein
LLTIEKARNHAPFSVTEMGFTVPFKYLCDRHRRCLNNFVICINKWQRKTLRQSLTNGGLPNAHHADEGNGLAVCDCTRGLICFHVTTRYTQQCVVGQNTVA